MLTKRKLKGRQGEGKSIMQYLNQRYVKCFVCGFNSCLICLCCFSYKLITRSPKNEEKYSHTKNKYWHVCWIIMKRFQPMYMTKFFNNLELNGIREGFIVGGIIVLTKIIKGQIITQRDKM